MATGRREHHPLRARLTRRAFFGTAGSTAALVAVGCGDDDDDDEGGTPTSTTSDATDTATSTSTAEAPKQPKRGGKLIAAVASSPVHYDHQQIAGIQGDGRVYNQLLKLGAGQEILNDLAESYETPEPNVYIFKLRQGVKFQDIAPANGRAMVAEDVVYSIERARTDDPAFTNRWMWTSLTGLEALDDSTVKATFERPFGSALFHFAAPSAGVLAKEVVDQFGDLKEAKSRIGTGPFVLRDAKKDEIVTYERNPGYFDPALPYLDEIEHLVIPERLSRIVALRTGQVDMIPWQSGVSDIEEARRGMSDVTVDTRPSDAVTALGFNHAFAPLNDERVRQAIAAAIDHQELIRAAGGDEAGVVVGFAHPNGGKFALPESEIRELTKPDPAKARQLLEAAGHPDLEISVSVSSTDTTGLDLSAVMQQQLNKVGIKLNIDPQEVAAWLRKLQQKTYELIWIWAWTPALDPGQQFHGALRSDSAQNWWNANVPEMDQLDDKQQVETDLDKRAALVLEMERLNFKKA
ncbi:MAG: ABC transporter substrate-binding protein, partial [Dehalococcoidia bacterium]|nr:ABC transporter substrate-binding protein [Dehalococcoidia bacterium]